MVMRGMTVTEDELERTFHALTDASRRAMVVRLVEGQASVSELAAPLGLTLPTVMQHLQVLQRSGLVRTEKVGRVRVCRLRPALLREVEAWIASHRRAWERRLDLLGDVLDKAFPEDDEGTVR